MNIAALNRLLGNIDIYLLDQLLKGRFTKEMRILDAGCGEGRNLIYFLHEGFSVFGVDSNPVAIQMARTYATTIRPDVDRLRFQVAKVEDLPFHVGAFQAVISSAVLHFSESTDHFRTLFGEMMRVLAPGGLLFLRMTTGAEGIIEKSQEIGAGVYRLPDGSERFLLTEELMDEMATAYQLQHLEAPKSVLVHGKRAMGVFMMQKAR